MATSPRLTDIARQACSGLVTLGLIATLSFFVVRLAPGDPSHAADPTVPRAHSEELRQLYGQDRSWPEQYAAWLAALATGGLGWSTHYREPVMRVLWQALPHTLLLASVALLARYGLAIGLAFLSCRRRRLRQGLDLITTTLYALPTFWLGLLALHGLADGLGWFPASGSSRPTAGSWLEGLHHVALPAAILALGEMALLFRLTTDSLARTLASPFALAAKARGMGSRRLLRVHAARNAAPLAAQRLALDLPALLSGSLVIEVLFSRPGLGRVAHQAFLARDYPLLAAVTTVAGALVVVGSLAADVAHSLLDPRLEND